jgi:hypothetical protein
MSPLPAFEGEMAAQGTDVPPAVTAASKCLAICIEVSHLTNKVTISSLRRSTRSSIPSVTGLGRRSSGLGRLRSGRITSYVMVKS